MALPRFAPDHFTLALVGTVVLASLLPASGPMARVLEVATTGVVSLLFFLHGAKLSRQAILGGLGHWRLHLSIFAATFALFPLLGWALRPVLDGILEPLQQHARRKGILLLAAPAPDLPATVLGDVGRLRQVLNALGVSRGALGRVVVEQACWIGGLGFVLAALASAVLLSIASSYRVPVALNLSAVLACGFLVAVLSLLSGLGAMRSLLRADPATLLR